MLGEAVVLSSYAFGSSQKSQRHFEDSKVKLSGAQSCSMARALPAIVDTIPAPTEQDSTATMIPSQTSEQSSSGQTRGHHHSTTLAQRTGWPLGNNTIRNPPAGEPQGQSHQQLIQVSNHDTRQPLSFVRFPQLQPTATDRVDVTQSSHPPPPRPG